MHRKRRNQGTQEMCHPKQSIQTLINGGEETLVTAIRHAINYDHVNANFTVPRKRTKSGLPSSDTSYEDIFLGYVGTNVLDTKLQKIL